MSSEPAHTPQRMPRADEGASAPLTEPRGQADHLMRERRLSGVEAEQAVESYEEYMIGRHLMMFDNFSVEVKGKTHSKYNVQFTFTSRDGLSDSATWAVLVDFTTMKELLMELTPLYPSLVDFSFPGKALFNTTAVQRRREKAFTELARTLLRVYPTPKSVLDLFAMNEHNADYVRLVTTYPPSHPPPCMRYLLGNYKEGDFEDIDGDGVVGTVEDEKALEVLKAAQAKEQKSSDTFTVVLMIGGGLLFSMLCQAVRDSGGIHPFYLSIPERVLSLGHNAKLYMNCLCWVLMVAVPLPSLLGWGLGLFLTSLLGEEYGSFHFTCDWISLRLGMEHNELKIWNLCWRNPSVFTKTPYFFKVKDISLVFNLRSLINAVRYGHELKIYTFSITGLTVFIEKIKPAEAVFSGSNELNLWACLGAGPGIEEGAKMRSSIKGMMTMALKSSTNLAEAAIDTLLLNPANMMHSGLMGLGRMINKNRPGLLLTKTKSGKDCEGEAGGPGADEGYKDFDSDSDADDDEVSPIDDEGDGGGDGDGDREPPMADVNIKKEEEDEDGHWGVSFALQVQRLKVSDTTLYAADFLNDSAECVGDCNKKQKVVINLIDMRKKELMNSNSKTKGQVVGLYLDEMVWRLISRIIGNLLSSNALSLGLLAGTAAISQGVGMVKNTGRMARDKMKEGIHNYSAMKLLRVVSKQLNRNSSRVTIVQDADMKRMNISKLRVQVFSLMQAKRHDNHKVKTASVELSLTNQAGGVVAETNVRAGSLYYAVDFGEEFELCPVQGFKSVLQIKVLRKVMYGVSGCYCHGTIDLRDRLQIGIREWAEVKLTLTAGDPATGLNDSPNCNSEGMLILKCMLC